MAKDSDIILCGLYIAIGIQVRYTDSILEKVSLFWRLSPEMEVVKMAVSKAQQKAVAKYEAKAYDKVLLRLPKGRLDELKVYTMAHGESVNGFIGRAIQEAMERDSGGTASETAGSSIESTQGAGVSLPSKPLRAAQGAAQSTGETVSQFVERAVSIQVQRDQASLKLGINPVAGTKPETDQE